MTNSAITSENVFVKTANAFNKFFAGQPLYVKIVVPAVATLITGTAVMVAVEVVKAIAA